MDTVPLVMMAATKIGERQGQELYHDAETWLGCQRKRGDGDYRRRTGYGTSPYNGFYGCAESGRIPEKRNTYTKSNDIPGAFDAANSMLVQHPEVKHG